MNIHELRSFVVLAEQLHFGRAALVLHLSQPALTKQMRRLEDELGSQLFERGTHGARLGAFGGQFLVEVRDVVERFDHLLEFGRKSALGETGRLRIGFGYHTLELVPRVIAKLRHTTPDVQITLRDMSTAEQVAALKAGEIDLGFARLPVSKEFEVMPAIEDRLALITSAQPPRPKDFSLADCRNEPFIAISQERSPGFYGHMLALCARHGFHPRIVQEVNEFTTALALVRSGLGVTMMPESFKTNRFAGVQLHPLREKAAAWSVGAAWRRRDTNPALHRFLKLLQTESKATTPR